MARKGTPGTLSFLGQLPPATPLYTIVELVHSKLIALLLLVKNFFSFLYFSRGTLVTLLALYSGRRVAKCARCTRLLRAQLGVLARQGA